MEESPISSSVGPSSSTKPVTNLPQKPVQAQKGDLSESSLCVHIGHLGIQCIYL
jgi:hypothetical protein